MSKVDAQRAMREARYARNNADGPNRSATTAAKAPSTVPSARTPRVKREVATDAAPPVAAAETADGALCGHKSMNGRTCTREAGHAAKSHRYG